MFKAIFKAILKACDLTPQLTIMARGLHWQEGCRPAKSKVFSWEKDRDSKKEHIQGMFKAFLIDL